MLYKKMHIGRSHTLFCIRMAVILFFVRGYDVIPSQPCFGLTTSFWTHTIRTFKDYTDTMGTWEVTLSKLLSIVSDFEREEHLKYKLA